MYLLTSKTFVKMKRADLNPLFKLYDSTTYDDNIDFTKSGNINAYAASGFNNLEKGQKLFDFDYIPILEENVYKELLDYYDNSIVFVELYRIISFNYFTLYADCIKWYIENSKSFDAFNLDIQIRKYELKVQDNFSCPIVRYVDLEFLDNINVFRNIKNIMSYSETKNINSINILLYGDNEIIRINKPPTVHGKLLLNSIVNIAYNRFFNFLLSENGAQKKSSIKLPNKKNRIDTINAASLRLFCSIVHQCGIIKRGDEEEAGNYCDKVL